MIGHGGDGHLAGLLRDLLAELQVQNNPDRRALAQLKLRPGSFGWTETPYHAKAFEIWENLLRKGTDDAQTLHHLAIMYHARAFDLEVGDEPESSDPDWRRAHELWHRLWLDEKFWETLTARAEPGAANPFLEIRERWPVQLLGVHMAIALDDLTKNYRRQAHMRFLLESPFPQPLKDRVRLSAFEHATAHVPPSVWESDAFDPEAIGDAMQAVTHYLDVDGSFLPALKDLAGLLRKLQSGHVQRINASEGEERQRALRLLATLATQFDPYLKRMEEQTARLETDALADLLWWHSRSGQARRILGQYRAAAVSFARAYRAAQVDNSPRTQGYRKEWLECSLLQARESAESGRQDWPEAREILSELAMESELPASCLALRARVHFVLEEFEEAESDCRGAVGGIAAAKAATDPDAAEQAEVLQSECQDLLNRILRTRRERSVAPRLEAAREAMKEEGGMEKAIALLSQAAAIDRANTMVLYLRARCYCRLLEPEMAHADAERALEILGGAGHTAEDMEGTVQRLLADIQSLREEIESWGGPESYKLQQEAALQMQYGQWDRAASSLRHAVRAARRDCPALKRQLSACLTKLAPRKAGAERQLLLTEALSLDSMNALARDLLHDLGQERGGPGVAGAD
jgi:tetratricopeptide (TPR) repeat protein